METDKTAIQQAAENVGGPSALARACGVSPQAVNKWLMKQAPSKQCVRIESVSGVSRHELRPDVFGPCSNSK
jgi:DNA-binding transcriptional regulator YdaS (Cro superfamily)